MQLKAICMFLCGILLQFSAVEAIPSLILNALNLDSKEMSRSRALLNRRTRQPEIVRARIVRIDYGILKSMQGRVAFDLFPGTRIVVDLKSAKNYSTLHDKHSRWIGVPLDDPHGEVSVSVWGDKRLFADISSSGRQYRIQPAGDSLSLITQYDPGKIPPFRESDGPETGHVDGKDGKDGTDE
jgi:hypothetical protein